MSTTSPTASPPAASHNLLRTMPQPDQLSSPSSSDWLGASLLAAKAITAAADSAPFTYMRGVFAMVVVVLESIEKVKKNKDDLKYLCGNVIEIMRIMQSHANFHDDLDTAKLENLCTDFQR
ncbi:hypothetical protein GGX14DRAFT_571099 [Mycena pura]|uniref:Uncharacterized protein n=1 Tax=Mycena pura TaxID=153505 RepID=A0AAD6V460_9AGAR|nr:hypothetical protein GGX14DRAFT_571099 [Mycena pura]